VWHALPTSLAALVVLAGCSGPPGTGVPEVSAFPVGARVDYQLGGAYPPEDGVRGVVRDRTAAPVVGLWSACYVNAFQTQPGSGDWPEDLILHDTSGARVADPEWPDEHLLDISSPSKRDQVVVIVGAWIEECAADGYSAVELDNLDSYTRSRGLLDVDDAAATARILVDRAHEAGLAVGQKNAPELAGAGLGFDYAVAEDCGRYGECDAYTDVYGAAVMDVEYTDAGFLAACRLDGLSTQRRDLAVSVPAAANYVSQWCPTR
jgi:hypothetical protein